MTTKMRVLFPQTAGKEPIDTFSLVFMRSTYIQTFIALSFVNTHNTQSYIDSTFTPFWSRVQRGHDMH